jgi:hypothetical protein
MRLLPRGIMMMNQISQVFFSYAPIHKVLSYVSDMFIVEALPL